jgi:hypothetical protein
MADNATWLGRNAASISATLTAVGEVGRACRRIPKVRRIVGTVSAVENRRSR